MDPARPPQSCRLIPRALPCVLAVAVLGASAVAAPVRAASEDQQTDPRMHPRTGKRHTAFAVRLTLRRAPGVQGVYESSYRVVVIAPDGVREACTPPAPQAVTTGEAGERVRVALPAPRRGWCVGRYRVTVLLERGPYCPPDSSDPCPEFATQEIDTGHTRFRVRPAS